MRKSDYGQIIKGAEWRTKGMADLLAGTERRLKDGFDGGLSEVG